MSQIHDFIITTSWFIIIIIIIIVAIVAIVVTRRPSPEAFEALNNDVWVLL